MNEAKWRMLNIGDEIFCVRRLDKEIIKTKVEEIHIDKKGLRLKAERFNYWFPSDWLDNTVFINQQEAEDELKRVINEAEAINQKS